MRSRIFAGGGLAVLAALVAAAIIVTNPLSTDAAVEDRLIVAAPQTEVLPRADVMVADEVSQPDDMGQLQPAPNSEEIGKPYIGVVIYPLSDGSVKVLEDGPSHGALEVGDIIAAVNDEVVDGVKDLTNTIAEAGVGAALTLTVTRDGSDMDAAVTVGEWTEKAYPERIASHKAARGQDRVSSSRIAIADDDGNYHTYRTVFGNLTALDADAGTFTL